MILDSNLTHEYEHLFDKCIINSFKITEIKNTIVKILANKDKYDKIQELTKIPWYFASGIHLMESSLNFSTHLHNGDSLKQKTIHVPIGRPITGKPPFTWIISAIDALTLKGLKNLSSWEIPEILYRLESYNGFGYRQYHNTVLSPYLWSYSNHYIKGKYAFDGKFDPNLISNQCGAAVLLKQMEIEGIISI